MVKRSRILAFFLVLIILAGTLGTTTKGIIHNIKLGLDLQGGFEVLYEVKPAKKGDKIDKTTLTSTVSALNKRINVLGVSEPNIQVEGKKPDSRPACRCERSKSGAANFIDPSEADLSRCA